MKAIQTKYVPSGNVLGARIIAWAGSNRVILSWDDALSTEGNHDAAAIALCHKLGWTQDSLMRGALEDRAHRDMGNVYTFDAHSNRVRIPDAMREAEIVGRKCANHQ